MSRLREFVLKGEVEWYMLATSTKWLRTSFPSPSLCPIAVLPPLRYTQTPCTPLMHNPLSVPEHFFGANVH